MEVTGISLNGLDLMSGEYAFDVGGLFGIEKDVQTSDLYINGAAFGRSKIKPKTLTMNGMVQSGNIAALNALNAALASNNLKPIIVTINGLGQLTGNVEVTNRASTDDSRIISCQLTMPDPYLYALAPQTIQLGAQYSTGVIFSAGQGITFGPRNVVQNGDFSQGTAGWTCFPGGSMAVTNQILHSLGSIGVYAKQSSNYSPVGERFFYACKVRWTDGTQPAFLGMSGGFTTSGTPNAIAKNPAQNQWYVIRGINDTNIEDRNAPQIWADVACSIEIDGKFGCTCADMGADANNPLFNLAADEMAAKFPTYQAEYGGVVFGTATGEGAILTNSGNADAYPVITVVGTCANITITNSTTGESVSVSPALQDTDTLIIDCRPLTRGVYLNGVANIGLKTNAGWIHCQPGDNLFLFSRASLQNKKHCTVQLQSRWI